MFAEQMCLLFGRVDAVLKGFLHSVLFFARGQKRKPSSIHSRRVLAWLI
jgi:hypothetical protein